MEKIAAVIVTFNRKKLLSECLDSLLAQTRKLDEIILVDNASSDGTKEMIEEKYPQISYTILPENVGGAGGFHEGVKQAFEKKHDWVWIMDDDCELPKSSLELLTQSKKFIPETAALSNIKRDEDNTILYKHASKFYLKAFRGEEGFYDTFNIDTDTDIPIDYSSFIGILVNAKAIEQVGLPDKRLFLQYDDVEYSFRIRQYGEIYLIPKSILIHKEKDNYEERTVFGKLFKRGKVQGIWKDYYGMRNIFIFVHRKHFPQFTYLYIFAYYFKTILGTIIIDSHKIERIYIYTKGFFDGLFKKYDHRVTPGLIPFHKGK